MEPDYDQYDTTNEKEKQAFVDLSPIAVQAKAKIRLTAPPDARTSSRKRDFG
jgi:hypothetical protein